MNNTMIDNGYTLNIQDEFTSRNGITYRIATHPDFNGVSVLLDNNNAIGKWYLLKLGSREDLIAMVKRNCSR